MRDVSHDRKLCRQIRERIGVAKVIVIGSATAAAAFAGAAVLEHDIDILGLDGDLPFAAECGRMDLREGTTSNLLAELDVVQVNLVGGANVAKAGWDTSRLSCGREGERSETGRLGAVGGGSEESRKYWCPSTRIEGVGVGLGVF